MVILDTWFLILIVNQQLRLITTELRPPDFGQIFVNQFQKNKGQRPHTAHALFHCSMLGPLYSLTLTFHKLVRHHEKTTFSTRSEIQSIVAIG